MIFMRRYLAVIFLVFATACSSEMEPEVPEDLSSLENLSVYSGETSPLNDISLERQARYGDMDDVYIGSMSGVAVAYDGTLYLADRTEAVIHIYSAAGEYQTIIGGKGEGPGEFLSVSSVRLHEGELFALDTQ